MIFEKVFKLYSWIYTILYVLFFRTLPLFYFFFEMWLSTLRTMAEEIVPKKKKKEVKLRRESAKETRRREKMGGGGV